MINPRFVRTAVALGLGSLLSLGSVVAAQPTTLSVYQDLAAACAAQIPDVPETLAIRTPSGQPYLEHALTAYWVGRGQTVVDADSLFGPSKPPLLDLSADRAQVHYERSGRGKVSRTVLLDLRYRLVDASGRVLTAGGCAEPFVDEIARKDISAVENQAFPETRAEAPPAGWFRRYIQPAAVVAATTVTVFLLFNLRSDRSNDPS